MKYRASFIAAGVTLAAVIAGGSILAAALSTPPSPARTSARLRRTRSRTRPQRATHPASIAITASRAIRTISIEAGSASREQRRAGALMSGRNGWKGKKVRPGAIASPGHPSTGRMTRFRCAPDNRKGGRLSLQGSGWLPAAEDGLRHVHDSGPRIAWAVAANTEIMASKGACPSSGSIRATLAEISVRAARMKAVFIPSARRSVKVLSKAAMHFS